MKRQCASVVPVRLACAREEQPISFIGAMPAGQTSTDRVALGPHCIDHSTRLAVLATLWVVRPIIPRQVPLTPKSVARLGVDIGGTFTDVALELGERRFTSKILTTTKAPEEGVLAAIRAVIGEAKIEPAQVA